MKMKEESAKALLELNIQKTNIMASGPITSSQTDGEKWQTLFWGGSKIIVDGDCSHEIKRKNSWKNSCDQPRQLIKDITLPTNVRLVKLWFFQ